MMEHATRYLPDLGLIEDEDGYWYLESHPGEGIRFRELPEAIQREIDRREWRSFQRWYPLVMLAVLATALAVIALGEHFQ